MQENVGKVWHFMLSSVSDCSILVDLLGYFCQSINHLYIVICSIKYHQQGKNSIWLYQFNSQKEMKVNINSIVVWFIASSHPIFNGFFRAVLLNMCCSTCNGVVIPTAGSWYTIGEYLLVRRKKNQLYFEDSINAQALQHKSVMVDVYSKMKPDSFK